MSTKKAVARKGKRSRAAQDGPPLVAFVFSAAGILLGYLSGEVIFAARPHPVHWAVGLALGIIGWVAGKIYFRYKGDIA